MSTENPINQAQVACAIAQETVEAVNALIGAQENLEKLQAWRTDADVTDFATWEADIQVVLPHVDGAMINKMLGVVIGKIRTDMEAATISGGPYDGETHMEMVHKVRDE